MRKAKFSLVFLLYILDYFSLTRSSGETDKLYDRFSPHFPVNFHGNLWSFNELAKWSRLDTHSNQISIAIFKAKLGKLWGNFFFIQFLWPELHENFMACLFFDLRDENDYIMLRMEILLTQFFYGVKIFNVTELFEVLWRS